MPTPPRGTHHPRVAPRRTPGADTWAGQWRYGLLGLPLAFVALPLYVHLPHVYASRYGMSLADLGAVLLLTRLFDALIDPWLGQLGDRLQARSPQAVLRAGAVAAALLLVGMGLLFFPPWSQPGTPQRLLPVLVLTCTAYSLLTIAHQAWGARLGGDEAQRARIVAWREGAALLGVVLASVLPHWLGWDVWITVFAIALALGWLAWHHGPAPAASSTPQPQPGPRVPAYPTGQPPRSGVLQPWCQPPFRRLIGVFMLNGLASAIPATLVLFFIQDRLAAPQLQPLFLALYFTAAAASLPLWMRCVGRWGLARSWLGGMLLSVAVFAWAATLSAGDTLGFGGICILSGMALGSDLALPSALLAKLVAQRESSDHSQGAYFGWWNLANKLNLALAAGLALPLLEHLGYLPGTASAQGLQALTLAYAVVPCALKLLAAGALYLGWVRFPWAPPAPRPIYE